MSSARRSPASASAKGVPSYKIVLLGESAVGKSSIVLRFVRDDFDDYRESTIGAAFLSQTVTIADERSIKFEIWDTAGQERYKSLAPMYYRSSRAALVAYDVTSGASLEKAKAWIKELHRQADPNIIIALVGNKADLDEQREVATETAQQYANEENSLFFETSAKTGAGIRDVFMAIAEKLATMDPPPTKQQGVQLDAKPASSLTDGCAC